MGCHAGAAPAQGMSLEPGSAFGEIVGVPASECMDGRLRVEPGAPTTSYLIHKLTGVAMCSGNMMPARGSSIPSSQLALIQGWICEGAPNN